MKQCSANFPIAFYNQNEKEIDEFFTPHDIDKDNSELEISITFVIHHESDLLDKVRTFVARHPHVPMTFWQEQDVGGYDFSDGQDIYVLPDGRISAVSSKNKYDNVDIETLERVKNMDELKEVINSVKESNPRPHMIPFFSSYNEKEEKRQEMLNILEEVICIDCCDENEDSRKITVLRNVMNVIRKVSDID